MQNKYSLGIGLNLFDARAVILRDDGKIIAGVKKGRTNINANETIKVLLELFEEILSKAKKYRNDIKGVGLALGGIVNSKKGFVYWPQKHGSYISLPLSDYLEKKFGLPILIENDASACAWAEHMINFPKQNNIIYMFSGVGCGIIADGKLYKGRDGGAGELFLNFHKVMSSRLGDFSFFKQWPIDLDIVKRAKELISLGRDSSLVKRISPTGELFLNDIFEEVKKKDKVAREVVKEAAFSLGAKIAFLVNLLNPEAVIIGGGLEDAGEFLLEECIDSVKKFAFTEMKKNCKISLSGLGADATAHGAAMLVFK
jgi:predicted NBD/HSP70 family sugar kinase